MMDLASDDIDTLVKPCIRCGYDLRGHDQTGRCPECGLKTYWSFRAPEKLSQYPGGWVTRMAFATKLLLYAYAGLFSIPLVGFLGLLPNQEGQFALIVLGAVAVLQVLGTWMLSSWSRHWNERRAPINRWTLRIAPVALLFAIGCFIYQSQQYDPLLQRIAIGALIVGAAAPVAIFLRLRAVARMIANAGLAEHSAIVGWGFFFTAAFIALVPVAESKGWLSAGHDGDMGLLIMVVLDASVLLFLLWGAFIFLSCTIDFGRAAKVASAEWNADAPEV